MKKKKPNARLLVVGMTMMMVGLFLAYKRQMIDGVLFFLLGGAMIFIFFEERHRSAVAGKKTSRMNVWSPNDEDDDDEDDDEEVDALPRPSFRGRGRGYVGGEMEDIFPTAVRRGRPIGSRGRHAHT